MSPDFFLAKDQSGGFHRINYADVLFIKSVGNYLQIVTKVDLFTIHGSLQALYATLQSDDRFMQIHRSFVINLEHVEHISSEEVTMGKQKIPIGKKFWEDLKTGFIQAHLIKL